MRSLLKRWCNVGGVAIVIGAAVTTIPLVAQAAPQPSSPPTYSWPEAHQGPSLDGTNTDPAISTSNASSLGVQWMTYLGGDPY